MKQRNLDQPALSDSLKLNVRLVWKIGLGRIHETE